MNETDQGLLKDYIQLAIQEQIGQQSNNMTQLFNRRISQKQFEKRKEELKKMKQELDQKIQEKIDSVEDKNQLKVPENREEITQELLQEIDADFGQKLEEVFKQQNEQKDKPIIRTNIIQSEIFNDDGTLNSIRNIEKIQERMQQSKPPLENRSILRMSKIRQNFWEQDYKKFDTKKLFHFFEVLRNYNFFVQFQEEDLENIQGALLLTLHSDDRNMNEFIFSEYFSEFMLKFTDQFQTDFEAEIDSSVLFTSPHLTLICSFNPKLCHYLDQKLFFEQIVQYIQEIRNENYQIFLKAIINIIKNYPQGVSKLMSLNILIKLCEKMLPQSNITQTTLFFMLLNNLTKCKISPIQIFTQEQLQNILQSVVHFFEANDELRIYSHKLRYNRSQFKTQDVSDQHIINEIYKKQYNEFITEKSTLKKYDQINSIAISVLRFFSENFRVLDKHYDKQIMARKIFDFLFIFYYQDNCLKFGLKSLMKIIDRTLLIMYRDEFFKTEFFHNIFITIERIPISISTLEVMENFQKLILMFLETIQLQEQTLSIKDLKTVLDYSYRIQKTLVNYFDSLKYKYLNKSLIKYIEKINLPSNRAIFEKISFVSSQNTLLLQKISHTHDLDTNMNFMQMNLINEGLIKSNQFKEKKLIEQYLSDSHRILYIVQKVDRKSGYLFKIDELITQTLKNMDAYIQKLIDENQSVDFPIVYEILKYLVQVLFYLKENDEELKKKFSQNTLQQEINLMVKIFRNAKVIVDMTQNSNIYMMFENFNLFSHLYYNYDLKFQDQQAYLFFKFLDYEPKHSNAFKGYLNDDQVFQMLDFSNSLSEVKQKCIFINFLIVKVLDFILTQVETSVINKKLLVQTVKKIFEYKIEKDIHKIDPKFLLNYSQNLLQEAGITEQFTIFVVKNDLYFNQFICKKIKKVLSKNYQYEDFQDNPTIIKVLKFNILEEIPEDSNDMVHLMFQKAQENLPFKNSFQDIIHNIKRYFQKEPTQENKQLVIQLFQQTNIFEKLIKLHKKNKVNLSKVLKYLLIILQNYNLFDQIEIPTRLISGILKQKNVEEFQDVYIYLFNYILERQQYGDYKESIDQYFVNTKKFLDSFLFFSKPIDYQMHLKTIYYSLKNLNHVQLLAPESLNLDVNEFILKYIFQLFEENYKLEISPVNNIYQYFNRYFEDKKENQFTKYEKKIAKIILDILKSQENEQAQTDFFVVNKLLSFCFYIIDTYPIDMYKDLYFQFLEFGLSWEKENPYKENFNDFYLVLFYNFNLQQEKISQHMASYIGDSTPDDNFQSNIDELKNHIKSFENITINMQIRTCLKLYYLTKTQHKKISNSSFKNLMKVLNNLFQDNYDQVHQISQYEKLVIELYMLINFLKRAKSNNTAAIFLSIFERENDFKMDSQIDKYIYMGLFNNFFCKFDKKTFFEIDTLKIEKTRNYQEIFQFEERYKKIELKQDQLQEIILQLELGDIAQPKELILHEFIRNIYFFRKSAILNLDFTEKMIINIINQIKNTIDKFAQQDEVHEKDQQLLNFRILFLTYIVKKYVQYPDISLDIKKEFYDKIGQLFTDVNEQCAEIINDKKKEFNHTAFAGVVIKIFYQLFRLDELLNLNNYKTDILNFYDKILKQYSADNLQSKQQQHIFYWITHKVCLMVANTYDQFRLQQQESLLNKILKFIQSPVLKTYMKELELENLPENKEKNDEQLVEEESKIEGEEAETESQYKFRKEINLEANIENCYFIFFKISQNYFILDINKKKKIFKFVELYQDIIYEDLYLKYVTEQLILYYTKNIPIGDEKLKNQKERKLKNILYVHKLLETIQKNLQINHDISPKEIDFMKFALKGLKIQINENVDKSIYNQLNVFDILSDIFLQDSVEEQEKIMILEIINFYLESTEDDNRIGSKVFEGFFKFHETLIFDKYQKCVKPYYQTIELILEYVPMEKEFIDSYFDKFTYSLFKTKTEVPEQVFINAIFVFAKIFRLYEVNYNLEKMTLTIYNYLKIHHKNMQLYQKGAFAEVVIVLQKRSNMDQIKLENMLMFVNLKFENNNIEQTKRVLQSLENINKVTEYKQSFLKLLGFELLFKQIIQKFGGNFNIAQPGAKLYLSYTNSYEVKGKQQREQIEMYQTIKNILNYIDYYYAIEKQDLVLIYYKCLSNACMNKANADYLIQNQIQNVICKCYYEDNYEFYLIVTSMLVNISYIFEIGEQNFSKLYDSKLISKLSYIYQQSIEKEWIEITGNIFDLFIILIEQEFYDIFNQEFLHQIKLTIYIYYNNPKVLLRFLTILKNLSLVHIPHVLLMLRQNFDAIFLYHIHFRYYEDQLINSLVKHLIFNIMIRDSQNAKQKDLLLFGIPENIVHTFSLDDTSDTILVNLKIVQFSLKFEKCLIFVKDHFLTTIREIVFGREENLTVKCREIALKIYFGLLSFYKSAEQLYSYFYFNDIQKLFETLDIYSTQENIIYTTLLAIRNLLKHDRNSVVKITEQHRRTLKIIVDKKESFVNEDIMKVIFDINNLIFVQNEVITEKYAMFEFKTDINSVDKQRLDMGIILNIYFDDKFYQNCKLRFDFVTNHFLISGINFYDKILEKEKQGIQFQGQHIKYIDHFDTYELDKFQENFRTYFEKEIPRNLFMSLKFLVYLTSSYETRTLYLIFKNEFTKNQWKSLFAKLKEELYKQ